MLWNNSPSSAKSTTDKGKETEHIAQQYLCAQGLEFVAANFHSRQGEIDLIMKDSNTYVFVEVKYRKNSNFGGAIASVTKSKQIKIKHSITFYLQQSGLNEYNTPCRIDVVSLEGDIHKPQITWLKNAF